MQDHLKPRWYDSYQYAGRRLKVLWDRNGGKILTVAGTTGMMAAGVHACRKTYRHHERLSENGRKMREAKINGRGAYLKASAEAALDTVKCFLTDIVGGALGAVAVSKGWKIEHTHFQEATAMVGIIAGSFLNYRQNVIAEQGVEADRRYLTTKREHKKVLGVELEDGTKLEAASDAKSEGEGLVVSVEPDMLKILYSEDTTPMVWSPSHLIRMQQLETIRNKLDKLLICGGHYTVNDVRREFYGVKGDVAAGGLFGRVWDPGNPEHPERGGKVNLHYQEDEDFMYGLKSQCWIIIDIDDEPLLETLKADGIEDIFRKDGGF